MSYQRLKCPRGHVFRAYVASRYSRIECTECRNAQSQSSYSQPAASVTSDPFVFSASDCSSPDSGSSGGFSSGGGGDYGGGGASGSWSSD